MAIKNVNALRTGAIIGIPVFLILYSIMFALFASTGMPLSEYGSVLSSRDAFLLQSFSDFLADAGATRTFLAVLALEAASGLAFGVGFASLFWLWAAKAGKNQLTAASHRTVAHFALLASALDIVGTAAMAVGLSVPPPVPAAWAMIAGIAYIVRLPLSYIILLWAVGFFIAGLIRRMSPKTKPSSSEGFAAPASQAPSRS
jgi:hypothetical protein